jgi:lipid-binding SYLF domain-containing protein
MKRISAFGVGLALVASSLSAFGETDKAKLTERLQNATAVINQIMATPDKGIPSSILAGASCVVVVPSYKKAAFLVGAQYGQGAATCRTPKGWSAPVFVQLAGGSFGFQIGGQSTDLILVAMNDQGLQDMLKNKFKIGADAAASAGPIGRNAQAGTDWKLNAEFLTYSRSKVCLLASTWMVRFSRKTRRTRARCTARTFLTPKCSRETRRLRSRLVLSFARLRSTSSLQASSVLAGDLNGRAAYGCPSFFVTKSKCPLRVGRAFARLF